MTTKEQFIEMAKGITRPGIDQMMAWLETTDFYTAPASTRFHGAEEGGLCAHSITVAKRLLEIADLWAPNQYSRDALLTVALFHDLCKISTYTVSTRNVKDDTTGQWTKVPFYKFEPKDSVGCDSHGSLSCYRIMATGMQLSMEEFAAVKIIWAFRMRQMQILSGPAMRCTRCLGCCMWRMRRLPHLTKSNRTSQCCSW